MKGGSLYQIGYTLHIELGHIIVSLWYILFTPPTTRIDNNMYVIDFYNYHLSLFSLELYNMYGKLFIMCFLLAGVIDKRSSVATQR